MINSQISVDTSWTNNLIQDLQNHSYPAAMLCAAKIQQAAIYDSVNHGWAAVQKADKQHALRAITHLLLLPAAPVTILIPALIPKLNDLLGLSTKWCVRPSLDWKGKVVKFSKEVSKAIRSDVGLKALIGLTSLGVLGVGTYSLFSSVSDLPAGPTDDFIYRHISYPLSVFAGCVVIESVARKLSRLGTGLENYRPNKATPDSRVETIQEMLPPQLYEQLLNFSYDVYDRSLRFISASSNKKSSTVRSLQLKCLRSSCIFESHEILDEVFNWNLDLHKPIDKTAFDIGERKIHVASSVMKMNELEQLVNKMQYSGVNLIFTNSYIEKVAVQALKWRIANCCEYSCLVYSMFVEFFSTNDIFINLEIIEINRNTGIGNFDHNFVLIGRDSSSDLNNPSSWGKFAIIVDPWWKKVGPVANHIDSLQNYAGYMSLLANGSVGQGHSSNWPKIFPNGLLLDYTPQMPSSEKISWADTEENEILLFAYETLELTKKSVNLNKLQKIKPFLINEELAKVLPFSILAGYFYAFLEFHEELTKSCFDCCFTQDDIYQLWRNQKIQNWFSGKFPNFPEDENASKISLKDSINLFALAYSNRQSSICEDMITINEDLQKFLIDNQFIFDRQTCDNLQYNSEGSKKLRAFLTIF